MVADGDLRAMILADPAVKALVVDRVHPVILPQPVDLPAVVLNVVSVVPVMSHAGPSGLMKVRVQVDCYGKTYLDAAKVAQALRTLLSGFRGFARGSNVPAVFLEAERDLYDSDLVLYRRSQDFIVWDAGT
jgi:hypothetical protein